MKKMLPRTARLALLVGALGSYSLAVAMGFKSNVEAETYKNSDPVVRQYFDAMHLSDSLTSARDEIGRYSQNHANADAPAVSLDVAISSLDREIQDLETRPEVVRYNNLVRQDASSDRTDVGLMLGSFGASLACFSLLVPSIVRPRRKKI